MSYAEVVWIFLGFQTILAHLGIVSNMFSTLTCLRCIIIPHGDLGQVHGQRPVEAAAPVRGRRGGLVWHRPKQTPPWTCLQVLLSSWSTQRHHVHSSSFIIYLHSLFIHHSLDHPHHHRLQAFPWQLLLHRDECRWTKSDVWPNRAGCPISTR